MQTNGQKPSITGLTCEALIALTFVHHGIVVDHANSVYMKFAGQWYRLYFDFDTVFWRRAETAPVEFDASQLDASYQLEDVAERFSLRGRRLEHIFEADISGGVAVDLIFEEAQTVRFACVNDMTEYSG